MSKRIDEIMQSSDNGYIEECDDISVILEHFLNYSMEELNNSLPQNHKILDLRQILLSSSAMSTSQTLLSLKK